MLELEDLLWVVDGGSDEEDEDVSAGRGATMSVILMVSVLVGASGPGRVTVSTTVSGGGVVVAPPSTLTIE